MPEPRNDLIVALPRIDRERLLDLCRPVDLVLAEVVFDAGEPTRYVHFPVTGFVSLLSVSGTSPPIEVGMVGREGMVGAQLALGVVTAPLRAVVQGPGTALRVAAGLFRRELARSVPLQRGLDRYLHVLMGQLATSAVCLRFHLIGPRLARWLLMTQDRAHSPRFHVTHEFLSTMLGVRRVGITTAAAQLQRVGLIRYRRGELTVLDRPGLEAMSCPCYQADRKIYRTTLGRHAVAPGF